MDKESLDNVTLLCSEHSPTPLKEKVDLEGKIGWFVKIPLKVSEEVQKEYPVEIEHVWIKVGWFDDESVEGVINNHPVYADEEFGDSIIAPRDQIEAVLPPTPLQVVK